MHWILKFFVKFYSLGSFFFFKSLCFFPSQIFIRFQLEVRLCMARSGEYRVIPLMTLRGLGTVKKFTEDCVSATVCVSVCVHTPMCTENLVRETGNKRIILKMTFRSFPTWSWVHIEGPGMSFGQPCDSRNHQAVAKLFSLERLNRWHRYDWGIHCCLCWDTRGLMIPPTFQAGCLPTTALVEIMKVHDPPKCDCDAQLPLAFK